MLSYSPPGGQSCFCFAICSALPPIENQSRWVSLSASAYAASSEVRIDNYVRYFPWTPGHLPSCHQEPPVFFFSIRMDISAQEYSGSRVCLSHAHHQTGIPSVSSQTRELEIEIILPLQLHTVSCMVSIAPTRTNNRRSLLIFHRSVTGLVPGFPDLGDPYFPSSMSRPRDCLRSVTSSFCILRTQAFHKDTYHGFSSSF